MSAFQSILSRTGKQGGAFPHVQRIDALLGFPHRFFCSVHVGGTNGKGSVSWKVARSLELAGFRVGLYSSPHIEDPRERIRINGEKIPLTEAEKWSSYLLSHPTEDLSFFDCLTMIAFLYFQEQKVDWAVIEVGLGGRLDATNVILPKAAAIVSIGFDHMAILGDSLEKIAAEKGGIIKPHVPLIVGPSAARFYPGAIATPKAFFYDIENQLVAEAILKEIGIDPSGIGERPPGRFQVEGRWIFDVAHNVDGFIRLKEALLFHYPEEKFHFLLSFGQDKPWKTCVEIIDSIATEVTLLSPGIPRLRMFEEKMKPTFLGKNNERIVATGSFYAMAPFFSIHKREGELSRLIHW